MDVVEQTVIDYSEQLTYMSLTLDSVVTLLTFVLFAVAVLIGIEILRNFNFWKW